ncbi:hypothetical protein AZH07_RS02350 [Acinetobacter baumannii]|nr:hypothetical protein [Acinetobacter baumannii]
MTYKPLTEAEVLAVLAEGELDASDLLYTANPHFEKCFKDLNLALATLLDEVRLYFPDANYYNHDGGIALLLGQSHSSESNQPAQQELIAVNSDALSGRLSGGDW